MSTVSESFSALLDNFLALDQAMESALIVENVSDTNYLKVDKERVACLKRLQDLAAALIALENDCIRQEIIRQDLVSVMLGDKPQDAGYLDFDEIKRMARERAASSILRQLKKKIDSLLEDDVDINRSDIQESLAQSEKEISEGKVEPLVEE